MIPHKLTISAFGPYGDKQVIDFDRFEGKGIFLITGDTGAGKTTIFDAITYALFGTLNNKDREAEDFRSHFADEHIPTFVELEFTHNEKDYVIRRSPRQFRPKQRGEGYTEEKATFFLESKGIRALTKKDEVNNKIQEILRISYNQWKQIAMLAQGEFRALLTAKTDDRTDTFRSIFSTKPIQDFQDELGRRAKAIKDEYDKAEAAVVESMRSIEIPKDSPYRDDLKDKMAVAYVNDALKVLSHEIDFDTEIKGDLEEELNGIQSRRDEVSRRMGETDNINKQLKNLEEHHRTRAELEAQKEIYDKIQNSINQRDDVIKTFEEPRKDMLSSRQEAQSKEMELNSKIQELTKARESLEECKTANESAISRTSELDNIKIESSELEKSKNIYQEIDKLRNSIPNLECELAESNSSLERKKKEKEKFENSMREKREFLDEFEDAGKNIENIDKLLEKNKSEEKDIKALQKKCKQFSDEEKNNTFFRKASDKARAKLDAKIAEYSSAEEKFFSASAGRLAEHLEEGEPCPVCGSTHHIKLACISEDAPSEDELDAIKKSLSKCHDSSTKADSDLRSSTDKLNGILGEIKSICNEKEISFNDVVTLDSICTESLKTLDSRKKDLTTKKKELEPMAEKVEIIREELKSSDDISERLEKSVLDAILDVEKKTHSLSSQNDKLKVMSDGVKFASLKELQERIDSLSKLRKDIEESIAKTTDAYNKANNEVNNITGTIETLNGQLENARKTCSDNESAYRDLLTKMSMTPEDVDAILSDKDSLESDKTKLLDFNQKVISNQLLIKQISESTKGKTYTDLTELAEQKASLDGEFEEINGRIREQSIRISKLEDSERDIKKAMKQMDSFDRESKDIIKLYEVASGSKGVRMSFESYIQGVYFKRVLAFANQRLQRMTDGRYKLLVRKPAKDGNSKIGLDIDVHDNYTGRSRPSDTLSGGESFKAALALALGLSDAVQTMSGGVHIDTLFVDEGFGSLDPESLRQAIGVLHDLSKCNNLIGIISHVDELKEEIDRKIVVKQADALHGSSVDIIIE